MAAGDLQNNGWFPSGIPWAEFVGKGSDHGTTASFGWDASSSQASFTILVNFTDGLAAIGDLLGNAQWNPTDGLLQRQLPMTHPLFPQMYCKRIAAMRPVKWVSKSVGGGMSAVGATVKASQYKYWLITAGFEVPPYRVISDAVLASKFSGNEYERFCTFTPKPSSYAITREGGTAFKWADNGSGGGSAPTVGNSFPSPLGQFLNQDVLEVRWFNLPREAVLSNYGKVNSNITACRNKLNNATFLGQVGGSASGVVRFDDYEVITTPSPLPPDILGLSSTDFNTTVDLVYRFAIFDPPYGNSSYRGHNLAPNNGDSKWYLVSADGTTTGASIYQTTNLASLFTLSLT